MPKRKYDCETCGTKDLSKAQYYREHHSRACLRAAVTALRQRQAPAADGSPAHEDAMDAHAGGEQWELPDSNQHPEAAYEPAVASEPQSATEDDCAADEPYCQPLKRLFGDAEAFDVVCQNIVPARDARSDSAATDQRPEADAPEAAALHGPELQVFEELQHRNLTEEAEAPVEADDPDAEHVYAAPEDQQFQGEPPSDAEAEQGNAEAEHGDAEAEHGATKPGTAAYYHAHRHDDLYEGAQLTVEQICYLMLSQKQTHRQHDTAFDEQCRLQRDVLLPKPNKMPGSLYLMRKIMRVRSVDEFEYHMCPNEDHAWDHIPRAAYAEHSQDTCPQCGAHRFLQDTLRPAKVYYDFGVANVIRKLFADPDWAAARGKGRDTSAAGFYGSCEAARLDRVTRGLFGKDSSSAYELGMDFGQIFNFKTHSTGIVLLRCYDLPPDMRARSAYHMPLLVIPGPKEPKKIKFYLARTLQAFCDLGPEGVGLTVQVPERQLGGSSSLHPMQHHIFLTAQCGDSPVRQKVANFPGHAASIACGFCLFQGAKLPGSRATKFLGYKWGAQQTMLPHLRNKFLKVGAPEVQLTDSLMHLRGRLVEERPELAETAGCTGLSPIPAALSYVSYSNVFVLPFAHTAFYGVVADFWAAVLAKYGREEAQKPWWVISHASRAIMRDRGATVSMPADMGRAYREVTEHHRDWLLHEWVVWVESISLHVLEDDILDPRLQPLWDALRSGLLHHLRLEGDPASPTPYSEAAISRAQRQLLRYAEGIEEQQLPKELLTYNLHILVCRLARQEAARGHVGKDIELWIERGVQRLKRNVKYRSTEYPEKIFVLAMLTDDALAAMRAANQVSGGPKLQRFDEWVPQYRATPLSGPSVDDGDASTGSLLLGKGKLVAQHERAAIVSIVEAFITRETPDGWASPLQGALLSIYHHSHADIRQREMVQSEAHTAAISRVSHFVQIRFQDGDQQPDSLHVASVQRYVRVQQAGHAGWLRLAICRVWKASRKHAGLLACNQATPRFGEIAVDVNSIDRKLIKAESARGAQRMHFMPYAKTSDMG